jgi:CBS-domain-containing membrane protein
MTKKVLTVDENASLGEVATLLETHRIKRVPVMRLGRIVGIVSRANLLQGLASSGAAAAPSGPTDAELRQRVIAAVKGETWANLRTTNITVANGVAELWGLVFNEAERDAWRVAVENVPGVLKVVDRRTTLSAARDLMFGAHEAV